MTLYQVDILRDKNKKDSKPVQEFYTASSIDRVWDHLKPELENDNTDILGIGARVNILKDLG